MSRPSCMVAIEKRRADSPFHWSRTTNIHHKISAYESTFQDDEMNQSQKDKFEIALPGDAGTWQQSPLDVHSSSCLRSLAVSISKFDYTTAIFWRPELVLFYNQAWADTRGISEQGRPTPGMCCKNVSPAASPYASQAMLCSESAANRRTTTTWYWLARCLGKVLTVLMAPYAK
jgi:hypothetical protein